LDSPDLLFETAMEAIDGAVEIFDQSPERMRLIEVSIEQGCLYRDYMYHLKGQNLPQYVDYIDRAIKPLNRALSLAQKLGYPRHQLDALVDLVWTHYYAGQTDKAEEAFKASLDFVSKHEGEKCFLRKSEAPPKPAAAEPYVFMLLGKAWTVRGRIRMDRFKKRGETIIARSKDKETGRLVTRADEEASMNLQEAAEAFVLALAYDQLYSTRSAALSIVYNILYDYLKTFNAIAMEDFFNYQRQAREEYRVAEIEPENMADLEVFLLQSFGDFFALTPAKNEVGQ
jgi:tetratricopeptide (TPR) repeat protein